METPVSENHRNDSLVPLGSKECEADVSRHSRFGKPREKGVPIQRAADIAAGDGIHHLVALIEHHRVPSGQQVLDRAVNRRLADQHLVSRVRVDCRGRGNRRVVQVDAAANPVETKCDRSQGLARPFMNTRGVSMLLMRERRVGTLSNHTECHREREKPPLVELEAYRNVRLSH